MDVRRTERPLAEPAEGTPEAGFAPEDAVEVALEDPAAGDDVTASAPEADWRSRLWKSRAVFWNWE